MVCEFGGNDNLSVGKVTQGQAWMNPTTNNTIPAENTKTDKGFDGAGHNFLQVIQNAYGNNCAGL